MLWQVFFYSRSIFVNAQIPEDYIPFAVMGVNAVNVAMTVIAVSRSSSMRLIGRFSNLFIYANHI